MSDFTLRDYGAADVLVHPDFQGCGIARALLEDLEATARRRGLFRMTAAASHMARPVFEALGFRMISPQEVELRGEVLVNFWMEKRLREG